jgi:pimeloyl-ACP methyl ester carboxylesterase
VVLLLHGFDSSALEFRRFLPLMQQAGVETWALDLFGAGFNGYPAGAPCSPAARRAHLRAFIEQHIGRPCVVLGASLGAATAIDLADAHPDLVSGLVIVDGQVWEEAPQLPGPLAYLGIQVLRTVWLRSLANKLAYKDKERLATDDAMRVGRLHTHLPHWSAASQDFMSSGGYRVADSVARCRQRTLLVWGKDDEIVPPATAVPRFEETLPNLARVVYVEDCGHVAHLEQPAALRDAVLAFLSEL